MKFSREPNGCWANKEKTAQNLRPKDLSWPISFNLTFHRVLPNRVDAFIFYILYFRFSDLCCRRYPLRQRSNQQPRGCCSRMPSSRRHWFPSAQTDAYRCYPGSFSLPAYSRLPDS